MKAPRGSLPSDCSHQPNRRLSAPLEGLAPLAGLVSPGVLASPAVPTLPSILDSAAAWTAARSSVFSAAVEQYLIYATRLFSAALDLR